MTDWKTYPPRVLKLRQQFDALKEDARAQLIDTLRLRPKIYAVTRYQSRTRETAIVDFFVIINGQPLSISQRIKALIPTMPTHRSFTIPPGNYSGIVLNKKQPRKLIADLSVLLFADAEALQVEDL